MVQKPTEVSEPIHKVKMMCDVRVPMRDGVTLSTDIFLPDVDYPTPVILVRTPYGNNSEGEVSQAFYFASCGYVVAVQDVRGRHDSDGEWYPFKNEAQDGYDTHEWLGVQSWCDGNVGMVGDSYIALVQLQAAPMRSKYLKAIIPRVGYSHTYHNWAYTGGAFQLGFNLRWAAVKMHTRTNQAQYLWFPEGNHLADLHWHLPLRTMDEAAGRNNKIWKDWIDHPSFDEYWESMQPVENLYDDIEVPIYGMGGWFDVFLQGTLNNFMGVQREGREPGRSNQKLIIGPWLHNLGNHGTQAEVGDMDFGHRVLVSLRNDCLRWFDYWLKGIDNGIADEAPVRVFVMGANEWRISSDWPIPGTEYVPYYLHSHGNANSLFGDGQLDTIQPSSEDSDSFVYDPSNPVMTLGGSTCCSENVTPVPMGPRDQQHVEWRPDVLVYDSKVLETDVEATGPVSMVLFAATDAKDTDFTAKLVDVYPDGRAINVAQGIIRARYRDSWETPTLLEPGVIYKYKIDLWSTSNRFLKGHRIRLEISSSNFPQFDRNPNTGHPFGLDAQLKVANQKIFHDAEYPSHLILPIVPVAP